MDLYLVFFRRCRESGEVHMRRDVLLARRFVGIGGSRVLTICHESSAVAAGKLFRPSVAIVNRKEEARALRCGKASHVLIRLQRKLDAFSRLGMHTVAVKKF